MATARLVSLQSAISKMHDELLKKSGKIDAGLARDIYREYANAQRERWMTQGMSEGERWKPLNSVYAKRKLKKYAGFPGRGTKMMIATGTLVGAATGTDLRYHRRLIERSRMTISITVPYAKYANEARNFTHFSRGTMQKIRARIRKYYFSDVSRGG